MTDEGADPEGSSPGRDALAWILRMPRADWRRALILSEVLGPPLALRRAPGHVRIVPPERPGDGNPSLLA